MLAQDQRLFACKTETHTQTLSKAVIYYSENKLLSPF